MKTTTGLGLLFLAMMPAAFTQLTLDNPLQNRALHKLLTGTEIQTIQATDPERFDRIHLYLTGSFDCEPLNCPECPVDPEVLFNSDLFNVFEHEALRLQNEPFSFTYREKYVITLHPYSQLTDVIGDVSPYELIRGIPFRPLPTWASSGDDLVDFALYKEDLLNWFNDFPRELHQLKRESSVVHIPFDQFLSLSPERRASLSQLLNGYLIIDDEISQLLHH